MEAKAVAVQDTSGRYCVVAHKDKKREMGAMEKIFTVGFSMTLAVVIVIRAMMNTRNEKKKRCRKS